MKDLRVSNLLRLGHAEDRNHKSILFPKLFLSYTFFTTRASKASTLGTFLFMKKKIIKDDSIWEILTNYDDFTF